MAGQAGAPRRVVPKTGFRLEFDQVGDVRARTCGALEQELTVIDIEEGGAATTVQHSLNKYKNKPVQVKRPLDLNDRKIEDWWENLKAGDEDHRNGTFFLVVAEQDVAKIALRDIVLTSYKQVEGDADADEDEQMEEFTFKYLGSDRLQLIS